MRPEGSVQTRIKNIAGSAGGRPLRRPTRFRRTPRAPASVTVPPGSATVFYPLNRANSRSRRASIFSDLAIVSLLFRICFSRASLSLRVCSIIRLAASSCCLSWSAGMQNQLRRGRHLKRQFPTRDRNNSGSNWPACRTCEGVNLQSDAARMRFDKSKPRHSVANRTLVPGYGRRK